MPLSREDAGGLKFNDVLRISRKGHQHHGERVRVRFVKPSGMVSVSIFGEDKVLKYNAFDSTTPTLGDPPALPSPKRKKVKVHKKKKAPAPEPLHHSGDMYEQLKTTAAGRAVCDNINQFSRTTITLLPRY